MQQSESIDSPSLFASDDTFNAIVQQWAKSRIDIPMQIIGRFDDAGKQLITIGSTLQGLYIAIFTFGNVKNQVPLGWLAVLSASLCLLVFCAAQAICTVPLKMEARDTYRLFRRRPDLPDADLTAALEKWCKDIDGIAHKKHLWLLCAKYLLFVNSLVSLFFLVRLMF